MLSCILNAKFWLLQQFVWCPCCSNSRKVSWSADKMCSGWWEWTGERLECYNVSHAPLRKANVFPVRALTPQDSRSSSPPESLALLIKICFDRDTQRKWRRSAVNQPIRRPLHLHLSSWGARFHQSHFTDRFSEHTVLPGADRQEKWRYAARPRRGAQEVCTLWDLIE